MKYQNRMVRFDSSDSDSSSEDEPVGNLPTSPPIAQLFKAKVYKGDIFRAWIVRTPETHLISKIAREI